MTVVDGQRAPALQRHAGVAPDTELGLDDVLGLGEGRVDVAGLLGEQVRLGVSAAVEVAERAGGVEQRRKLRHLHHHRLRAVLGDVRIGREHRGDRFADVANPVLGQDRLAVGHHLVGAHLPEVDERDIGHVGTGPDGGHAGNGQGLGGVDGLDHAVGHVGPHDPHVELVGQVEIGDEPSLAPQQGPVLQPRDRLADHGRIWSRTA